MTNYMTVTAPDTGKDGKTRFHKVGVAFFNDIGAKSFMTIRLFATPVNGELVLFEPKPKTDGDQATE